MPLLPNELARWRNNQLELRPQPLRLRWALGDFVTMDGHSLRLHFSCSVRGLPDPTERRMLQELLLQGGQSVNSETIVAHFTPSLREAAERVVQAQPVEALLNDEGKRSIADALRAAGDAVAFACGVELLPPFLVEAESPTVQQQRLRAMQRAAAEQQAAGQMEHLQRAGELLKQFQALRQSAPELSAGQVLHQINAADRGSVLQTLLAASAGTGAATGRDALWAVAGPYLVRIDAAGEIEAAPPADLFALPDAIGPLRSIQPADVDGERVLLVGARSGFMIVRPSDLSRPQIYADPELDSPLGFSRVVYRPADDAFVGCHGDGGIVRWSRGDAARPAEVIRTATLHPPGAQPSPRADFQTLANGSIVTSMIGVANGVPRAAGPRHLQQVDSSRIVFALGSELRGLGPSKPFEVPGETPETAADVVAVLPDARRLYVVHEDGTVCVRDRTTLAVTGRERHAGRVRTAAALPWLGEVRLLLAGDDGPVQCVGFDDGLVTQYATAHRGLRLLAGASALVAAVSPDRQRLVLWNSWDGRRPAAEVAVSALARHRIADVAFG